MKNKSFRIFHLVIIAVVAVVLVFLNKKPSSSLSGHDSSSALPAKRFPAALPKSPLKLQRRPVVKPISRSPASTPDFSKLVIPDSNVKLNPNLILTENIGAIPLNQWQIGMKPLLLRTDAYGFYEKQPGDPSIPVVYNPRTNKFHIVSSILQVQGVDQALRNDFKDKGFDEYVYFNNLKILFLRSSSDKVIKLYQDLQKEGFKVRLEVMKDRPKSR